VRRVLLVNPRSGGGAPSADELVARAKSRGVQVQILRQGEDLETLARAARADVLGVAGGDGTLAAVATVAIEQDVPFVCIPFGTRNHFATDAGLPADDPLLALAAFDDGRERAVDVGRAGDRLFLNNVSLGVYARLVHRRERRRRRRQAFARIRALATSIRDHAWAHDFIVDRTPVRASVLLVSNNEYRLDVFSLGARDRLDEGTLALYAARGLRRLRWTERKATEIVVEFRRPRMRAAVDGEPARLDSPLRLRVERGALRLLVPPEEREPGAVAGSGVEGDDEPRQDRQTGQHATRDVQQVVGAEHDSARRHDEDE
jgi:diacylglycerol kinase family enzyme